jgi:hypothetical protein
MRPRWEKIEKKRPWLATEYFDFDTDKEAISQYQLASGKLPAFIFLDKEGNEFLRLHGEVAEEELEKVVDENKDC